MVDGEVSCLEADELLALLLGTGRNGSQAGRFLDLPVLDLVIIAGGTTLALPMKDGCIEDNNASTHGRGGGAPSICEGCGVSSRLGFQTRVGNCVGAYWAAL